jgi:hypothetical protein
VLGQAFLPSAWGVLPLQMPVTKIVPNSFQHSSSSLNAYRVEKIITSKDVCFKHDHTEQNALPLKDK